MVAQKSQQQQHMLEEDFRCDGGELPADWPLLMVITLPALSAILLPIGL